MTPAKAKTDGDSKEGGLRSAGPVATFLVGLVREFGFSTVVLGVLLWMVFVKWGPPIAQNHLQLLQATTDSLRETMVVQKQNSLTLQQMAQMQLEMTVTQKSLTTAVDALNAGVTEIITSELDSRQFMKQVHAEHAATKQALECNAVKLDQVLELKSTQVPREDQ